MIEAFYSTGWMFCFCMLICPSQLPYKEPVSKTFNKTHHNIAHCKPCFHYCSQGKHFHHMPDHCKTWFFVQFPHHILCYNQTRLTRMSKHHQQLKQILTKVVISIQGAKMIRVGIKKIHTATFLITTLAFSVVPRARLSSTCLPSA